VVKRPVVKRPVFRDRVIIRRPIFRDRVIVRPIVLVNPLVQCAVFFDEDGHRLVGREFRHDPLFRACAAFFGFDPDD
jgi:hypothetical protein